MNNTTLIKLDIDGVLRDWENSLFSIYEKVHPTHRVIKPVVTWEIAPHFPDCKDISKFFKEDYANDVYAEALPYEGAIDFYVALTKAFKNVWLVTSQYKNTMYPTIKWCEKWLPNFYNTPIVFTHEKGKVGTDRFSTRILIDDGVHNLENELKYGGFPICVGKEYNKDALKLLTCGYFNHNTSHQTFDAILLSLTDVQIGESVVI